MGRPLRLMMANEQDLFVQIKRSNYYVRYVNETFCVFDNKVEAGVFHEALKLHTALQFTCKIENNVLSFFNTLD